MAGQQCARPSLVEVATSRVYGGESMNFSMLNTAANMPLGLNSRGDETLRKRMPAQRRSKSGGQGQLNIER